MDTLASDLSQVGSAATPVTRTTKERRPFLKLSPLLVPREVPEHLAPGLQELDHRIGDDLQIVVRALVNYTVARQITAQRSIGRPVGVVHGVLNRRRRAAREWILAILAGKVDETTLHTVSHTWVPQLAGTGPEVRDAVQIGADLIEFIRGAISGLVIADFAENLIPHAKALNSLETVLSLHLRALQELA